MRVETCGIASRHSLRMNKEQSRKGTQNVTLNRVQQLLLTLAIGIAGAGLSGSSGLAFSSEAQQMCTGDAMRLCGSEIPNIARIAACMHRQRAHVSAGCRAVMEREAAALRKSHRAAIE